MCIRDSIWAILLIFMRAFALGGGTFTGIEAVSNGLAIMRLSLIHISEPTRPY